MNFFGHMADITYSGYEQFIQDVDTCRNNMLTADKRLLEDNGITVVDLAEEFDLTNGRMRINCNGIPFECFFHYKSSEKLYVFLNGALTQQRPQFARWSYYKFLDGSVLNIADPMYTIYDDLLLGWYYGNTDYNLRLYVSDIVKVIAEKINVMHQNIIFYGSSGGGAAVIECASHIAGARAVAINPQVVLSEYSYADEFERITHNNLAQDNKWHRNSGIYFLQHNHGSKHFILVNLRCKPDMIQIENICKAMGISNIQYGLNVFGDLVIWLYDCECEPYVDSHNLQDNYCLVFAIEKLLENIENQNWAEEYGSFYRYINEWWYAWWRQELYWRSRQPNLRFLIECREMSRKIGIFGTGDDAEKMSRELLDIDGENFYSIGIVFDNDKKKEGMSFHGIKVVHPGAISNWTGYFVIILTTKFAESIMKQLEGYGLVYKNDFVLSNDLYK